MTYIINGKEYNVEIIHKKNKNTYIRFKNDTIHVTTNYFVPNASIKKLLDNNKEFLTKMIDKENLRNEKQNNFYFLGKPYNIVYVSNYKNVEMDNNHIYVSNEKTLKKWFNKNTEEIFSKELDVVYNKFEENIPYPKLKLRKMKTRWGVCNRKNNTITLNILLMNYEIDKIDYVIIHELSHFVYFNHSQAFWKVVSKYCQNYKMIRRELKD